MHSLTGKATLDDFDLLTLVAEIERIMNDRPITKLPSRPDDVATLTPGMVISSSVGDSLPPDVFMKSDGYRRSLRKTQYLADIFWEKWLSHYLPFLQPRQKWFATSPNIQVGDIVLLLDENCKRGQWPTAVVVETMPDGNDLVRRVRVQTADGKLLERDIRKLCLIEGNLD